MFVLACTEAGISLDMALLGHYWGKLRHREVDLVEALPPPISEKTYAGAHWIALSSTGKC